MFYAFINITTVWHAMLLFSPKESTFSCVFALTFTTASCTPKTFATLARILSLCGEIFGRCAMSVQSKLPMEYPSSFINRTASLTNTSLVCPFHFGSVSGNSCPISGNPSAPVMASTTQCINTSPSLCATHPRSCGISIPPMISFSSGNSAVDSRRCKSNPCPTRNGSTGAAPSTVASARARESAEAERVAEKAEKATKKAKDTAVTKYLII